MAEGKPNVLILGGVGFIGRNFVKYLVVNKLASKIRCVDKKIPITSYLNEEFDKIFDDDSVEFKQADLSNPAKVKSVFEHESIKFDYVVNLAAETRYGLPDDIYKKSVYDISVNCAKEASNRGVKKYVELSTAQIYEAGKKPSTEKSKLGPWTKLARMKANAEKEIKNIEGFKPIILRPAIVYGPADMNGLAPRIICASTYTHTKEKMKLLWNGDLRINTVHVDDVVRAIWFCFEKAEEGSEYNLADKSDLSQKKLGEIFEKIFGIKTGYWGSILSSLAKVKIKSAAEQANDTHVHPWGEMCKESKIDVTPLSPYIDVELLYNNAFAVDGSKIEKDGFKYEKPIVTKELIEEEIKYYQDMKLFPEFTPLK